MATDLERLVLTVEANTKQLERSMKKVEKTVDASFKKSAGATKKFQSSIVATQQKLASMGKVLAGAFAIGTLAQLPGILRSTISEASDIADVADKVGLTTTALQELRFAAQLSGVAANQLDTGMQRFARRLAEAANGSGELLPILKANNVELRKADGSMRSQNDLLDDYADLIKGAASEQEKLLLTFKAFDTEGAALVNVLRDGASGLNELKQEAYEAGGVIREDLIREMQNVDDEFDKLARTIGVTLKTAALETASVIAGLINSTKDYSERSISDLKSKLAEATTLAKNNASNSMGAMARQEIAEINEAIATLEKAKAVKPALGMGGSFGNSPSKPTLLPDLEAAARQKLAAAEAKRHQQSIDGVIESLNNQVMALAMTDEAQRLNNALSQAGVSINSEYGQAIAEKVEAITRLTAEQEQLVVESQRLNDALGLTENLGLSLFDSLIEGGEDFGETLEGIAKDLAKMALQSALFGSGPLASIMGTGGGGGGLGSILSKMFGGFRADGGPMSPGKAYVTGERGPEIVVPKTPSTVIPNHALGGGGGVVSVQVSVGDDGSIVPVVERVSGRVAVSVVQTAAPQIVSQAVQGSGAALGGGEHDAAMRRFGAKPQAIAR